MVVERYKGYSINRLRDGAYRVWDAKETFQVFSEQTGMLAFTLTAFYNPKRILQLEDKEAVITALMEPAMTAIRHKLDAGDLTDCSLHAESAIHAIAPEA
ncbi:MAG: hypothetical protein EXR51_01325 [Dehalococcoidia bacterium]|nr:hypothetical protein [Dehalococcoidia bacterium]